MAIFMLGMATMIHFEARAITEMRDMQVSDLEQGARPTSRWLRLHGRADLDRAERHGRHQSYRLYVPIVSTIDHNPVAAVLVLSQQQVQEGLLSEPEAGVGAVRGGEHVGDAGQGRAQRSFRRKGRRSPTMWW